MSSENDVSRPCRYCRRPVPQRSGRGRPREYCPTGDCQARAKHDRELRRTAPGLEGALAKAEDLYERMEQGLAAAIAPLAQALDTELSPRGVEARITAAKAEAQTQVAGALAERAEATERAIQAEQDARAAQDRAEEALHRTRAAEQEREAALTAAEQARTDAAQAIEAAQAEAEDAKAEAAEAIKAAQAAAERAVDEANAALAQARATADQSARDAQDARREADHARQETAAATAEAERSRDALAAAQESAARADRDRAAADARAQATEDARAHSDQRAATAEAERAAAVTAREVAVADAARMRAELTGARDALDKFHQELAEARLALRSEQVRAGELERERDAARTDANTQRERAVTAELRLPPPS